MSIKELIQQLQLPAAEQAVAQQLIQYAQTSQARVGLFGSFSVGKSELLNQILGRKGLLPTHTNETTAVVTRITYGEEERAELTCTNGSVERIPIDQLGAYVVGEAVEKIENITVALSSPAWLQQIEWIDTPGRNTKYAAHVTASEQAIIEADAAIYVLPWQGITVEDMVYLKDLILYQPHLYFVLNKVDRIEEGQGQTIEEVRQKVQAELREQLGQDFPVFALSAKTGYQLDEFREGFIPDLLSQWNRLKEQRFQHAIGQLLGKYEVYLQNELSLLEIACTKDEVLLEDQLRNIEAEQKKLQLQIEKELEMTKQVLATLQRDVEDVVDFSLRDAHRQLETTLTPLFQSKADPSAVNLLIDNQLLQVRNQVYSRFEEKLSRVTAERLQHPLSEFKQASVNIQYQEPTFAELQNRYEERLHSLAAQYQEKKVRLESLANHSDASEDERQSLRQGMAELEEQLLEDYVPKYVEEENFDREKFTKILGYVGKAGDIVVGIAAAVATAGASAGVQIAGKAGAQVAKETGKQVTKEVVKQAAKETGKQAAKEVVKQAAKETGKQAAKEVGKQAAKEAGKQLAKEVGKGAAKETGKQLAKHYGLEALKVVGAMTSPVETVAENIGKMIDQTRIPEQVLDQQHRQQFFMKKHKLEEKYSSLKRELQELQQSQKANETVSRNIEKKLQELEAKRLEEEKRLELAVKRDQELLRQRDFEISVKNQLQELITQEKKNYMTWMKLEVEQVALMLEKTIPSYYSEEFAKWKQQMEHLKDNFRSVQDEAQDREKAAHQQLQLCLQIRELFRHDS